MFPASLPADRRPQLAGRIAAFLDQYRHLSDAYIIEFFTEDAWRSLPAAWQSALQGLTYPQVADLLLDAAHEDRRYPTVWPLSLLAFRATAHALAFPRGRRRAPGGRAEAAKPEEFQENQSQSAMLGHVFRKHVKPKKQHEIRKLGALVKQLCEQTECGSVVDVGSGQGHLTRFLAFGLGLSVTAIEADHALVAMASKYDGQLLWALEKEKQKKSCSSQLAPPQSLPRHVAGWVNPKASWEAFVKQLQASDCVGKGPQTPCGPSKKRPRGPDHGGRPPADAAVTSQHQPGGRGEQPGDFVLTGLHACGDLSATLLRHFVSCPHVRGITSVACCYMKITTKENPVPPGLVEPPAPSLAGQDALPCEFGYPMSSCVRGLPGHELSYKAREGACHAMEDYIRRLREDSALLRTHCYRAMLETFIRDARPDLRRAGIQTIKKAHLLPFTEYARLGLARVGLPPGLPLDAERVAAMLGQQGRVVVFFSLALLLAPVVETLVLLDRMIYLQEHGVDSRLVALFDPNFSPRNFVLVAVKKRGQRGGEPRADVP